jgi:hypothetical protein
LALIGRKCASLKEQQVGQKLIPISKEMHELHKNFGALVQVLILDLQLLNAVV